MSDVFPVAESCSPLGQSCVSESPVGLNILPRSGHLFILCWSWHFTGHGVCDSTNDLLCNSVPAVCLVYRSGFEMDCD